MPRRRKDEEYIPAPTAEERRIPSPDELFPTPTKTTCFIRNVITAPNISVGEYTYYDDAEHPTEFERNNVLFNYPEFGDKLVIGKFCAIAQGTKFIMGAANHRLCSVTTYPFNVFGGRWGKEAPQHIKELPFKGDTVIGNDVWFGRECVIMPGVHIGDGSIVAAYSVVTKSFPPYSVIGGNPARLIKRRFDDETIEILTQVKWWDFPSEKLTGILPVLCSPDIDVVKKVLEGYVAAEKERLAKERASAEKSAAKRGKPAAE